MSHLAELQKSYEQNLNDPDDFEAAVEALTDEYVDELLESFRVASNKDANLADCAAENQGDLQIFLEALLRSEGDAQATLLAANKYRVEFKKSIEGYAYAAAELELAFKRKSLRLLRKNKRLQAQGI